MKVKNLVVILLAMFASAIDSQAQSFKGKKILIAYYSLRNGNTRVIAEQIKKNTGGDIFRIETVETYPEVYNELTAKAKKDLDAGYRPPLKDKVKNFEQYDVIFVGSPNWWNTITTSVMTFLESYNFEGKTIIPFITHEGSAMGASETDIKKPCPKAKILKGLPIRGSSVNDAQVDVEKWLKEIGF